MVDHTFETKIIMTQAAVRTVIQALRDRLEIIPSMAGSVYLDRSQEEPFGNAELPALNIKLLSIDFDAFDHAHDMHSADVDIDIIADSRNVSISDDQADLAASVVATLWADRTLGGMLQFLRPVTLAGDAENGAEVGIAALKYRLVYLTPVGNHFTVVGQSGQTF